MIWKWHRHFSEPYFSKSNFKVGLSWCMFSYLRLIGYGLYLFAVVFGLFICKLVVCEPIFSLSLAYNGVRHWSVNTPNIRKPENQRFTSDTRLNDRPVTAWESRQGTLKLLLLLLLPLPNIYCQYIGKVGTESTHTYKHLKTR
jgi:hypothetical protein